VSLERVEELAGKTVNFHNVDISDAEALDKIFKLVSRLKSLFHEFKRSNFHLFFCFFSVSIRLRHSFGRPEIGWRFLQFAARLLPE
jgi:AAA+ ATPase superfamily predicted ATPase